MGPKGFDIRYLKYGASLSVGGSVKTNKKLNCQRNQESGLRRLYELRPARSHGVNYAVRSTLEV